MLFLKALYYRKNCIFYEIAYTIAG